MEGGKQFLCSEHAKKTTKDVKPLQNVAKDILDEKEVCNSFSYIMKI